MTADLKDKSPLPAGNLALLGAALFVGGIMLAIGLQPAPGSAAFFVAAVALIAFHLALFPVVGALAAPPWAKAAAYGWLVVDNALSTAALNPDVATAPATMALVSGIRYGIHIAAALWIASAARAAPGPRLRWVGLATAVALGGYSFVYPWAPMAAFLPALVLLPTWLVLTGLSLRGPPSGVLAGQARAPLEGDAAP